MAALTQEEVQEIALKVKVFLANESQGVGEIPLATSRDGLRSLPALRKIGDDDMVVEAPLELLIGDTGRTPVLTFAVNAIEYGTKPTVTKTGTAEAPTITIGFPLALDGDKLVWRKTTTGIDIKYSREAESAYASLFTFADVMPDVSDFSEEGIRLLQKPATDAAEKVLKDTQELNNKFTADVEALEERAETVIRKTGESKGLADLATKNANDAAQLATDKAGVADTAAQNADDKAGKAHKATEETLLAKQETEKVKEDAKKATGLAVGATALAEKKAGEANDAAQLATDKAGVADKAAQNADKATEAAKNAANRATTLSNNRDKIISGYWWKYDEELKDYVNTTIRATGETGQGLNIVGRYQTVDLLFAAYPDGVVGCFEVGTESPYEIWYYDSPAREWRNSGRLQGPAGMTAFQVWKLQPGNEDKTELDFFKSLSPYIGQNLNWWLADVDLGIKAPGTDAYSPRINPDSHKWEVFDDAQQKYVETNCLAEGVSVNIEIVKNTPTEYILKFISAEGEFTTPNLIARPISNSGVIDIDHEPTIQDTHYTLDDIAYPYAIGQEVRFEDKDAGEFIFYKCYDNGAGGAVWEEVGSGGSLPFNVYLTPATDYDNLTPDVKYITNNLLND